ncbi:unnamed protein product [Moneuplotes crassus]|uniref:Uncharacterized protein n=1 Tax=Euplotes crassus TaxID=5936 RepID=A0AAD1ULU2_EUPCR|nr:unnamed protein product [Moneuplotes crassus]
MNPFIDNNDFSSLSQKNDLADPWHCFGQDSGANNLFGEMELKLEDLGFYDSQKQKSTPSGNKNPEITIDSKDIALSPLGALMKKKGVRSLTKSLKGRKDVILRSLLRKIRKFHRDLLTLKTSYSMKKRYTQPQRKEFLVTYIEEEFGLEPTEKLLNVFDQFLFLRPEDASLYKEMLYKFSCSRLKILLKDPSFNCLIYHYFFEVDQVTLDRDTRLGLQILMKIGGMC